MTGTSPPTPATADQTGTADTSRFRRVCCGSLVIFLLAVALRVAFMVGQGTYSISPKHNYWNGGWETGRIAWHLARGRT